MEKSSNTGDASAEQKKEALSRSSRRATFADARFVPTANSARGARLKREGNVSPSQELQPNSGWRRSRQEDDKTTRAPAKAITWTTSAEGQIGKGHPKGHAESRNFISSHRKEKWSLSLEPSDAFALAVKYLENIRLVSTLKNIKARARKARTPPHLDEPGRDSVYQIGWSNIIKLYQNYMNSPLS